MEKINYNKTVEIIAKLTAGVVLLSNLSLLRAEAEYLSTATDIKRTVTVRSSFEIKDNCVLAAQHTAHAFEREYLPGNYAYNPDNKKTFLIKYVIGNQPVIKYFAETDSVVICKDDLSHSNFSIKNLQNLSSTSTFDKQVKIDPRVIFNSSVLESLKGVNKKGKPVEITTQTDPKSVKELTSINNTFKGSPISNTYQFEGCLLGLNEQEVRNSKYVKKQNVEIFFPKAQLLLMRKDGYYQTLFKDISLPRIDPFVHGASGGKVTSLNPNLNFIGTVSRAAPNIKFQVASLNKYRSVPKLKLGLENCSRWGFTIENSQFVSIGAVFRDTKTQKKPTFTEKQYYTGRIK